MMIFKQIAEYDKNGEKVGRNDHNLLAEDELARANTSDSVTGKHAIAIDEFLNNTTDTTTPMKIDRISRPFDEEPKTFTVRQSNLCDKNEDTFLNVSTTLSDKDSVRKTSDDFVEQPSEDPSAVMIKRWESHIQLSNIPLVDQQDIQKDCPLITQIEIADEDTVNQHAPEFTQLSYKRLRSTEEEYAMSNYLDPQLNPKLQAYLQQKDLSDAVKFEEGRAIGISKLLDLHLRKGYRLETLFAAQNIFDRYLNLIGHWTYTNNYQFIVLATAATLFSAKLEEDVSPSFNRMCRLLTVQEQHYATKQVLINLEYDIILKFGFDFSFIGPVESMERYLRVLGYNKDKEVVSLARGILKYHIRLASLLNYRPSQIAACAVIIAINTKESRKFTDFEIWNKDETTAENTGYTTDMLRQPLQELAEQVKKRSIQRRF